jgi:hypothetical protein
MKKPNPSQILTRKDFPSDEAFAKHEAKRIREEGMAERKRLEAVGRLDKFKWTDS